MRVTHRALGIAMAVVATMLAPAACRATPDAPQILLAVVETGSSFRLDGSFVTPAPRAVAWSVLTDYDALDQFVSSMRHSKIRVRTADTLLVEQSAACRILVFNRTIHLLLSVQETPLRTIRFRDVAHRDVQSYIGSWELHDVPDGIRVDYRVAVTPRDGSTNRMAMGCARSSARGLLGEVAAEIARRAEASSALPVTSTVRPAARHLTASATGFPGRRAPVASAPSSLPRLQRGHMVLSK